MPSPVIGTLSGDALTQPRTSITLDPPTGWELQSHMMDSKGNLLPEAPASFRRLGEATVGQLADLHTLTLRFSQTTRITGISVSNDFKVEQGGSCVEGNVYEKDTTCRLLVRFTPQGPGNRLGKLTVSHTASATPDAFGIGGYGYSPIISFIPSMMSTVPGTYPSSVGLLSGAQNLAVDGSDTLWVSDTGNNVVRNMDSSGSFKTLASGYSAPWGITVDTFGEAYFSRPAANALHEVYDYGPVVQINGAGTGACTASTPCTLSSHIVTNPAELSMDPYNHMFFTEQTSGGAFSTVQPIPANLIFLYDPFPFQTNPQSAAAMDSGDNIYSLWANGSVCEIVQQSLYNAENSSVAFNKIAGGHTCGFAGDGGQAGNAEIGSLIGQFAFDTLGNLYFSDTKNQRVRRIDYTTGIIRTIAGDGTAGYIGDGGRANFAELNNPTGIAVDSQGQVYIISTATSPNQVIRKVTTEGVIYFGDGLKNSHSVAQMLVVSNTGNAPMTLTGTAIKGTNPTEFVIDPTTTSCILTSGATLQAGATCQIGVIFTPTAAGTRSAYLYLLDNTVTNTNTVFMYGVGTLPAANFAITSPTNGGSYSVSSPITFSVTVTSTLSPAPTGSVTFKVDGTTKATVTVASRAASTSISGLSTGSHTFSATYSGDANYAPGGPISVTITGTAAIGTPAVSLVPAMSPNASCGSMAFEVVVSGNSGTPTGKVQLMDGSNELASGSLTNGRTALTTPHLAPGTHALVARYDGDANNSPAASKALEQTVSGVGPCGPPVAGKLVRPWIPMF